MPHYDIWLSKKAEFLIIEPADKGYDVLEEILEMMKDEGHDISDLRREGSYFFPLRMRSPETVEEGGND